MDATRFLKGVASPWQFVLVLDRKWAPKFPFPEFEPDGRDDLDLKVSPDLLVDLAPLLTAAASGVALAADARRDVSKNRADLREGVGLPFGHLLAVWPQSPATSALAQQLLYRASTRCAAPQ